MNELKEYSNECSPFEESHDLDDQVKMFEISEAIHDLDSKLANLERALHLDRQK